MAHETILYGCIVGTGPLQSPRFYRELQEQNVLRIAALPDHDDYPYLSRSMFSVAGPDVSQGLSRAQAIHFGASMKYLEEEAIPLWIDKLEGLLKLLYWVEARVHINTEFLGHYSYCYQISASVLGTYSQQPDLTIEWSRIVVCDGKILESE